LLLAQCKILGLEIKILHKTVKSVLYLSEILIKCLHRNNSLTLLNINSQIFYRPKLLFKFTLKFFYLWNFSITRIQFWAIMKSQTSFNFKFGVDNFKLKRFEVFDLGVDLLSDVSDAKAAFYFNLLAFLGDLKTGYLKVFSAKRSAKILDFEISFHVFF